MPRPAGRGLPRTPIPNFAALYSTELYKAAKFGWGLVLDDRDGLFGAAVDGELDLLAERFGRVLVQHVEVVVVADLEHLGRHAHADGIALAQVVIDHHS